MALVRGSSSSIDLSRRNLIASSTTSLIALTAARPTSAAAPPHGGGTGRSAAAPVEPTADFAERGPYTIPQPQNLRIDPGALPPGLPPGSTPAAWLRVPGGSSTGSSAGGSAGAVLPLVVFSPGFLIPSRAYSGYLDHLASWGFPVVSYDVSPDGGGFLPDPAATALLTAVARAAAQEVGEKRGLYLIGHSRGAKLSVLAADALSAAGERVAALGLIDPVDQTYDSAAAPGSVSSLPALGTLCAAGVPVGIIGAGRNRDCIPPSAAYGAFAAACRGAGSGGGCWLAVAADAGHLQFIESPTDVQRSVCYASLKLDEAALQSWTRALLVRQGLGAPPGPDDLAEAAARQGARLGLAVKTMP